MYPTLPMFVARSVVDAKNSPKAETVSGFLILKITDASLRFVRVSDSPAAHCKEGFVELARPADGCRMVEVLAWCKPLRRRYVHEFAPLSW